MRQGHRLMRKRLASAFCLGALMVFAVFKAGFAGPAGDMTLGRSCSYPIG